MSDVTHDAGSAALCAERPAQRPAATPCLQIGPTTVGAGRPVYVIAQAGVNHDGDPGLARELIRPAAEAGADAVKFQVFSAYRLVTRTATAARYQKQAVQAHTQHEMRALQTVLGYHKVENLGADSRLLPVMVYLADTLCAHERYGCHLTAESQVLDEVLLASICVTEAQIQQIRAELSDQVETAEAILTG